MSCSFLWSNNKRKIRHTPKHTRHRYWVYCEIQRKRRP